MVDDSDKLWCYLLNKAQNFQAVIQQWFFEMLDMSIKFYSNNAILKLWHPVVLKKDTTAPDPTENHIV